jgi:hypothetical protein
VTQALPEMNRSFTGNKKLKRRMSQETSKEPISTELK